MREFFVIFIGIILVVSFAGHYQYKFEKDQISEEFRVWTKVTGNPNSLSLQEFITYKGIK